MFRKILIANRGEIACRIIRTARAMGIASVAVYSDADRDALHVEMADEAVGIGPPEASQSYLVIDKILHACRQTGADAVHPGYGFLAEQAAFPEALATAGIAFIGPNPRAIAALGDKIESKKLAAGAKVSTVPGYLGSIATDDEALEAVRGIGLPVMIKASAGGGGKGMRVVRDEGEVVEAVRAARSEALSSFGDDRVFVERYLERPRHIEIQVLGDKHGNVVSLGERECSIQRRNQKLIEESPSPAVDAAARARMGEQAVALARAVGYDSAGTVEFIMDQERRFYFLEMNTRLQVEHPVTEFVTGLDLVELMIRVAAGEPLPFMQRDVPMEGWAIEARLCAEDPTRNFLPSIGRLNVYRPPQTAADASSSPGRGVPIAAHQRDDRGGVNVPPAARHAARTASDARHAPPPGEGRRAAASSNVGTSTTAISVRVDSGVTEGSDVSVYYDSLIAKLIVHAVDRDIATEAMAHALDAFAVEGVANNRAFLAAVMASGRWREGRLSTNFIAEEFPQGFAAAVPERPVVECLARVAIAMALRQRERLAELPGRLNGEGKGSRADWIVRIGSEQLTATAVRQPGRQVNVALGSAPAHTLASDWFPGDPVWQGTIDGADTIVQVRRHNGAVSLSHRGVTVKVEVMPPHIAALAALMLAKRDTGTARELRCPMPGLVRAVLPTPGQKVVAGEPLAIVEAMKMENVLRAERDATVARVVAKPGDTLAVDAVILEFE